MGSPSFNLQHLRLELLWSTVNSWLVHFGNCLLRVLLNTPLDSHVQWEFRYVHTRLRIHAESIAFFGGDELEGNVCHEAFKKLSLHDDTVARASWRYEILNDFVIQRFPPIVTWALSFLYTKNQGDRIALDRGGQLSHDLRYVSATVSHTFSSFGELLELQKRLAELSG